MESNPIPEKFKKALLQFLTYHPDDAADAAAWLDRQSNTADGAEDACNQMLICLQGDN